MRYTDWRELVEGKPIEQTADEYDIKDYKYAAITTHRKGGKNEQEA